MAKILSALYVLFFIFVMLPALFAQSSLNPDISVIPDFRMFTTTEKDVPEKNRINFSLEEIEMAIQAPLNPYARADVYIAFANDESAPVDIEEAYFTIQKGLPWNLNVKGGKFLVDFSKLNTVHPHIYPFVFRPLYQQNFFGEEGLKDVGIELNTLLPTGEIYTKLSGTMSAGDELDGDRKNLFYSSRISSFFQLSDLTALETGVGGATGVYDTTSKRFKWINADIKFKWKKDQYTSFTLWTEGLLSQFNGAKTYGGYIAGNYQFKRRFEIGGKFDLSQSIDSKDKTHLISGNFNFLPVEETLVFRLVFSNTKTANKKSFNTILMQTVFSLGPHKAHAF
ncbi:hypothetical protein JNM05_08430 [bacterium]|nr:hypothetical protein [bacterium]